MSNQQNDIFYEHQQETNMIFVKCQSHRSRENLYRLLNAEPRGYYSVNRQTGTGGVYKIEEKYLNGALEIKGITKFKDKGDLAPCWNGK